MMVWRRRVLVISVALIVTISALGVSVLQTPVYQAAGQILLSRSQLDESYNITTAALTDTQMSNLKSVLVSDQVSSRARAAGGTAVVRASSSSGSNVVTLIGEDPDPRIAVTTVSNYFAAYSDFLREQDNRTLDTAASSLDTRITEVRNQLATAAPEQTSSLQAQLISLDAQLGKVQTQRGLAAGSATIIQQPVAPVTPSSPTPLRDGLLGFVLGLVLGASIAVLIETLRRRPDGEREGARAETPESDGGPGGSLPANSGNAASSTRPNVFPPADTGGSNGKTPVLTQYTENAANDDGRLAAVPVGSGPRNGQIPQYPSPHPRT